LWHWSKETGLRTCTITNRLDNPGWPVDRALTTPARPVSARGCGLRYRSQAGPRVAAADTAQGREKVKAERLGITTAELVALAVQLHHEGGLGTAPLARALGCSDCRARHLLKRAEFRMALLAACPAAADALRRRVRRFTGGRQGHRPAWRGTRQEVQECMDRGVNPALWPEDFMGPGWPTTLPTSATPGSEAKIAVLAARYARRESLFHPGDAGHYGPDVPDLPPGPVPPRVETADERRRRLLCTAPPKRRLRLWETTSGASA
jgi:hypothetical protein